MNKKIIESINRLFKEAEVPILEQIDNSMSAFMKNGGTVPVLIIMGRDTADELGEELSFNSGGKEFKLKTGNIIYQMRLIIDDDLIYPNIVLI